MPDADPALSLHARHAVIAPRLFDGEAMAADRAVLVQGDRIQDVVPAARAPRGWAQVRLSPGRVLAPGFIDVQVNGGGGVLLNDRPTLDGVEILVNAHRRHGTTGCLPTLITDLPETVDRLAGIAGDALMLPGVLGFHLEGPFLSLERKGVHPAQHIRRPAPEDVDRLRPFGRSGRSLVTLAPEAVPPGFIRELTAAGLRVAAGHTAATHAQIMAAADEGLTGVTHLFNAMSQIASGREPGTVGAAMDDRRLTAGIIADGLHVDPVNLRIAFRATGRERLMLVTDAMPSVGLADGRFTLLGREVTLAEGRLTTADGTLAGAHLTMAEAVRNAMAMMGATLEDALVMASRTPARFLGLDDRLGRIAPGCYADMVAFDDRIAVTQTWIRGGMLAHEAVRA